jgi:HPt (histidine-containing phosphotransfer) domain-containing protein
MMIVHALTGSLANIGALALSDEAAALEVACKDGGTDAWYRMESFTDGLRELLSRIEAALSGTEANSPPGAEFPPAETLMRLKDALVKRNIGVIDALLEELTQPRYGRGVTDALSSVSERVLMSDFDEAAGIVAGLLKEAAK